MRSDKAFHQRSARERRAKRNRSIAIEPLEDRALLSGPPIYSPPMSTPIMNPTPILVPTHPAPLPTTTPTHANPVPIVAPSKPVTPISGPTPKTRHAAHSPRPVAKEHAVAQHNASGVVHKAPHFYEF